jgi:NitT/TauT family transport system permease protein
VSTPTLSEAAVLPEAVPESPRRPRRRRIVTRSSVTVLVARLLLIAAVLGLWELLSGAPDAVLPDDVVGTPVSVGHRGWQLIMDGQLPSNLGSTALTIFYALLLAIPIGVGIGLLAANPIGRWLFHPIITLTYAIPKVGLISLYVLLLGANTKTHVVLVTGAALFVYYFSVLQASTEIDRRTLTALRMMGAGPLRIAWSYLLPSSVPYLFAATRIALPLAFATEIFAEIKVPATPGLGALLTRLTGALDAPGSMAVVIFVVIVGYLVDVVLGGLLARYTRSIGRGIPT